MAKLNINLDHVESASRVLDRLRDMSVGEADWEWGLKRQCPSFWPFIEKLMTHADVGVDMRKLFTFVFQAVYASMQGFPTLRDDHFKEVLGHYPVKEPAKAASLARERGYELIKPVSEGWSRQIQDLESVSMVRMHHGAHFGFWCAVIVLLARALDEPFRRLLAEYQQPSFDDVLSKSDEPKKPKAKEVLAVAPTVSGISFDDLGGVHEAKQELIRLAARYNQPSVGQRWGSKSVKVVLLKGPKGTGKTTLAHAVANAIHAPFFKFMTSDVLSVWVNHSAMNLAAIFKQVEEGGGGVIFLDEADAIIAQRGSASGHNEDNKVTNQWNQCIDAIGSGSRILVILATNFMGNLDDAAIREGRVDLVLDVPPPQSDLERREILRAHIAQIERRAGARVFKESINHTLLAVSMNGLTGASIENVINIALRKKEDEDIAGKQPGLVTTEDLLMALEKRSRERKDAAKKPVGFRSSAPSVPEASVGRTVIPVKTPGRP